MVSFIIISTDNSFATQYARIQELNFYAKYLRRRLEKTPIVPDGYAPGVMKEDQMNVFVSYLYTLLSILQIMDIYGSDYWMGHSYLAAIHFQTGKFLLAIEPVAVIVPWINSELSNLTGEGYFSSLDAAAHFSKALDYYGKAERLHHAGDEYKETISDIICLEDDFNDSAYYFGAALDRYKMNNGLFSKRVSICKEMLKRIREKGNGG